MRARVSKQVSFPSARWRRCRDHVRGCAHALRWFPNNDTRCRRRWLRGGRAHQQHLKRQRRSRSTDRSARAAADRTYRHGAGKGVTCTCSMAAYRRPIQSWQACSRGLARLPMTQRLQPARHRSAGAIAGATLGVAPGHRRRCSNAQCESSADVAAIVDGARWVIEDHSQSARRSRIGHSSPIPRRTSRRWIHRPRRCGRREFQ